MFTKPWENPETKFRQIESIKRKARQHRHIQTWMNKMELKGMKKPQVKAKVKSMAQCMSGAGVASLKRDTWKCIEKYFLELGKQDLECSKNSVNVRSLS